MSDSPVSFPCDRLPENPAHARLLGIYPQRVVPGPADQPAVTSPPALFLQRVKISGGTLTAAQWKALAAAVRKYTPHTPLHLTTRQDIEFHDLAAESVGPLQQDLHAAHLSSLGAAGDTVRNITLCTGSGLEVGAVDLLHLARQIQSLLAEQEGIYQLPRKFKISLSACHHGCAQPWINDLGLIAIRQAGQWGFEVIAGGSLGANPSLGISVFPFLRSFEVLPCVLGAVRLFAREGDRIHRAKARLRHVRERLGSVAFIAAMKQALADARSLCDWPAVELAEGSVEFHGKLELVFANGDVTPEAAAALGELAGRGDMVIRLDNHHRVVLFSNDMALRGKLGQYDALRPALTERPTLVACPGTRWCSRGIINTNALAGRIRRELGEALADKTVCISGCPNNCAQSAIAQVGIIGGMGQRDGQRQELYDLYAGGGMGKSAQLADLLGRKLSGQELMEQLKPLGGEPSRRLPSDEA